VRTLSLDVPSVASSTTLYIGGGLLRRLGVLLSGIAYTRLVVIADSGAARRWLEPVCEALRVSTDETLVLEGGEQNKDVSGLERIWEFFVDRKLDRKSLVVTLGGGATSDVVGFAAATYMRGITFVNIPTTLLAQVDASIGGKTGINFGGAKNIVGAVIQPAAVIIDIDTLDTLPPRALKSGFAEILKHGLIADRAYWDKVTACECTGWSTADIEEVVYRSCEIKRAVVQADERETGLRKTLNFGHTVGHACEAYALEYDVSLTHGEAVAIGMAAEALISARLGNISESEYTDVVAKIEQTGLPTRMSVPVLPETLMTYIGRDKKNVGGAIKWVLLEAIGKAVYDVAVPEAIVIEALGSVNP
jgi:3-dehydroquinate synthase